MLSCVVGLIAFLPALSHSITVSFKPTWQKLPKQKARATGRQDFTYQLWYGFFIKVLGYSTNKVIRPSCGPKLSAWVCKLYHILTMQASNNLLGDIKILSARKTVLYLYNTGSNILHPAEQIKKRLWAVFCLRRGSKALNVPYVRIRSPIELN